MELEGFGVSLVGRSTWIIGRQIPWEYVQGTHYVYKMLIRGSRPTLADIEGEWNTIWCPQAKDWSFLATILRGIGTSTCLLVMDHVDPPASFWHFLDTIRGVTKLWIHEEAPAFVPDAVFFPPLKVPELAEQALRVFQALPARNGHGPWNAPSWDSIVTATAAQDLGLVVSDIEESTWTLMWHRPDDSRLPTEKAAPIARHWIQLGVEIL
jgi:hypothetical protein